jgi:hypothetical protein
MSDAFDNCPDAAEVVVFDYDTAVGFLVKWSLPGVGFGELSFAYLKEPKTWTIDDELVSAETLGRIFATAFPQGGTTVLDHQNLGTALTVSALAKVFDLIDGGHKGTELGMFGSADMNRLVDRYREAKGP